jgi:NAD-reducing hydrogenase small subunit
MNQKLRVGTCWLDGCSGCHMSLLDLDEALADVLKRVEVAFGPLVDAQEFPENVDVAIVEGAVSSQDDFKLARVLRERSRVVVALGDCAVTSNVPAMRNAIPVRALLDRVYVEGSALPALPTTGVPQLLPHALPLHDVIRVDVHVPGCPPRPGAILHVLLDLFEGRKLTAGPRLHFG